MTDWLGQYPMPLLGGAPGPKPTSERWIEALEPYWRWRVRNWCAAPRPEWDDNLRRRLAYQSARRARLEAEIRDLDRLIADLS
jgi:hypothetical protein